SMHALAARLAVPALTAADLDGMRAANAAFAQALATGDVPAAQGPRLPARSAAVRAGPGRRAGRAGKRWFSASAARRGVV
ncbi:hypothetical protein K7G98_43100, partial [Saccharothrix sp. MB29]|nr:hypothetical protein [Saccharothrix sp. MB29]